jgi:hypothetical protein
MRGRAIAIAACCTGPGTEGVVVGQPWRNRKLCAASWPWLESASGLRAAIIEGMPGDLGSLAKMLIGVGIALVLVGLVLLVVDHIPGLRLGRLPGDMVLQRGSFRLYFPLTTCILVSVVLTLLFWIFGRR